LDRALTGAGLGEWTYDVKARTLLISRRRAELLGFSLSEVGEAFPQHEWQDWVHPDDLDRIAPKIQELLSGQTNLLELEIRVRAKSGEWRWTMHRGTIVERDDDGSPLLIVGMMNDITERKQTEQRRLELELEKERVQILSNFITQASHEFRTPLTIIGTGAYLLKRTDDSDKKARHIYNIENQVKFINTLIDALTTMAKLDGIRELTTEEVDLRGIITTVHETQQQTLQSKDIHSTLELETQPLLVQADIDYLQQAIEAIVDNAVHFTPEGGTITICASSSDGNAIIEIIDTGVGIDADDLSHIFERFYRADKAGTTRGFGLGLPIAKRILELHQGRIEVESMLEQGSTFRILMPLSG
jgi:PAS domain S-box-containing protein